MYVVSNKQKGSLGSDNGKNEPKGYKYISPVLKQGVARSLLKAVRMTEVGHGKWQNNSESWVWWPTPVILVPRR